MFGKTALVYQSKKKDDWDKAQKLLSDAGVEFNAWKAEEPPIAGCGSKIDPRKFMRKVEIPKEIYRIEVDKDSRSNAEKILQGNVLPVISYGL